MNRNLKFRWPGLMEIVSILIISCMLGCHDEGMKTSKASTTTKSDKKNPTNVTKKSNKVGKVSAEVSSTANADAKKGKDGVYNKVDVMPEFKGGRDDLSNYISDHIFYPKKALDENAEATVTISCVIDEKGNVVNPVVKGNDPGYGLAQEAMRVVQEMPKWKPGKVNGKAVKTRVELPIVFRLADQ